MIHISEVKEKRFWCHSCPEEVELGDKQLFQVTVDKPLREELLDVASFRLCRDCLLELTRKINDIT